MISLARRDKMWSALSSANFSVFLVCFSYLFSTWIHICSLSFCISPSFTFWLEHPKLDQNPKFTPLSETMSIPTPVICRAPSPDSIVHFLVGIFRGRGGGGGAFKGSLSRGVSLKPSKSVTLFKTKIAHFATLSKTKDHIFGPWLVTFRFAFRIR